MSIAVLFVAGRAGLAMPEPGDPTGAERIVAEATGSAALRIPIASPPGPGGIAPELALTYSSRGGDGPFGVGWSLDLPEIRCSARFGVPDFGSCARYELGDALLVRDPAAVNRYHTVIETFQRILAHGSGASIWWTVEQMNGAKLTLGQSATHRVLQAGKPARWLLESLEDAFGNRIEFSHQRDAGEEAYLASVRYGAAPAAREIAFLYEPRPDVRPSFAGGVARKLARRLREVRVLSAGRIYRRYLFRYDAPGTTARSRLASVQEFGTDCTGADPLVDCVGLPPRTFRFRDADDVGSAPYSQANDDAAYRLPLGDYISAWGPIARNGFPVLIGDLNGDGLPDRLEILASSPLVPGSVRILINTGSGFHGTSSSGAFGDAARRFHQSFSQLAYEKPRWEYRQIRAPMTGSFYEDANWNPWMYAMCSVTRVTRVATLSQELWARGASARTSSVGQLLASGGAPSDGYFEPIPSLKMVDLDSDGLADLVVSLRLGGVSRDFDCNGTRLAAPERFAAVTVAVVFRNTGAGWQRDDALAIGLPPFDEVIAKSTYQTERDEPSPDIVIGREAAENPCANRSLWGFEQHWPNTAQGNQQRGAVCHDLIDLAPQFVDFDGDGIVDLAALERDDPSSFDTGIDYWTESLRNPARTHVWVQRPGATPRWQRAPQYDLPIAARPVVRWIPGLAHAGLQHFLDGAGGGGYRCHSWEGIFPTCSPNTYRFDNGVRLSDMNHDGLVDVVWSFEGQGVLLNTGRGNPNVPASAWCASEPDDAPLVGSACPEASAYRLPGPLAGYLYSNVPVTYGLLADLNGDRFPDYVLEDVVLRADKSFQSWIQQTGGSAPASAWRRDARFDFRLQCDSCTVPHPVTGQPVGLVEVFPRYEALDIDGDGSDDIVGDTNAFLSRTRHSDLVRNVDNGRGGAIAIEYASMSRQRDDALEAEAAALPWSDAAGPVPLWRPTPVVARVIATAPNLAPPGEATDYRYAHPRFSQALRSDLGFGAVRRTRTGGSAIASFLYQDPGRTARIARRVVLDTGSVVHRYSATWEHVPGAIPGSIAGVYHARAVDEQSAHEYGQYPGALTRRRFVYDDGYGFDFVAQVETERASTATTRVLVPESADLGRWIVGLVRERRERDLRSSWSSRSEFVYTAEGRLASELRHRDRGDGSAPAADLTRYEYDRLGNLIRRIDANGHATGYGYDASGSVLVSRTDPPVRAGEPGRVTRWSVHPVLVAPIAVDPGYRDEPRSEWVLDRFGRTVETWLVPKQPSLEDERVLASAVHYEDAAVPPYVERFQYASRALDAIRTAVIDDGFGGVWKTIRDAGPGANGAPRHLGVAYYRDAVRRIARVTYELPCAGDDLCRGVTGAAENPASVTRSDALGRPLQVDTPRGSARHRYDAGFELIAQGGSRALALVDVSWTQNAKGDLVRRSLDGERVLAVEECANSDPQRTDLGQAVCARGDGPNRTLYAYHASGRLESLLDPVAVDRRWNAPHQPLRYHYDSAGQLIAIDDPDAGHSETWYDGIGNVVRTINARGQQRATEFDALDRRTRITTPEGQIVFAYRAAERQLQRESGPGYAKTYFYDGFGRVDQEHRLGLGVHQFAASRYDLLGRRTWFTVFGNTIRHEYAGAFLQRVCTTSVVAAVSCTDPAATAILSQVGYDALGRRSALSMPGGVRTFAYDDAAARDLREDRFAGASALAFTSLARDPLGNVLGWEITGPPGTSASGSYGYDARNRIASATRRAPGLADAAETFAYDALGNLVAIGGVTQEFAHPTKPHALTRRGAVTYGYDASGNRWRAGSRHFSFDSADRLVCVGSAAGQCDQLRVVYDATGERVAEQAGTTVRGYLGPEQVRTIAPGLDQSQLEILAFGERVAYLTMQAPRLGAAPVVFDRELPPGWLALPPAALLAWCLALALRGGLVAGVARRPARAALVGLLIAAALVPSPALATGNAWSWSVSLRWVISDGLGSGVAVVDEAGRLLHQTRFRPFGAVDEGEYHAASEPSPRRYFAGHPQQAETGLHYMNARWLDPQTGTFLSVDPVVAAPEDPQSSNAYAYARNNPVALRDPSGAFWEGPLRELQTCNRCSGFSIMPGFYMAADSTSGANPTTPQQTTDTRAPESVMDSGPFAPSQPNTSAGFTGGNVFASGFEGALAAIGEAAAGVGSAIARVAEVLAWDIALAFVGIAGNAIGVVLGLVMAAQGLALLNPAMVAAGLVSSFWSLVPRYGFWSGPGWGKPNADGLGSWPGPFSEQNVIEQATYQHDLHHREVGADRQLIRDVWTRSDLGPYGQLYRLGLTGAFATGIALGMDD